MESQHKVCPRTFLVCPTKPDMSFLKKKLLATCSSPLPERGKTCSWLKACAEKHVDLLQVDLTNFLASGVSFIGLEADEGLFRKSNKHATFALPFHSS